MSVAHPLSDPARAKFRKPTVKDLALLAPVGITVAAIVLKETTTLPTWRTKGRMLQVDGREVHVLGTSAVGPTVVLESDMGEPLWVWQWVLRLLQADESTSVLAYERPGIGLSEAAAQSATYRHPEHLMAVLEAAGAPPPYILVGHSMGGLLTRMFAARYPDMVAGMVFVDPAHPDQFQRSDTQRQRLEVLAGQLGKLIWRSRFLLPPPSKVKQKYADLPGSTPEVAAAMATTVSTLRTAQRELELGRSVWPAAARELSHLHCPVAVVGAGLVLSEEPILGDLHQELTELSDATRSEVVTGAGHLTVLTDRDHAQHVIAAIDWVRSSSTPATTKTEVAS